MLFRNQLVDVLMALHINKLQSNIPMSSAKYLVLRRTCSTNSNSESVGLPPLMQFPEIIWPSMIKSINNLILPALVIRPYFDRNFNIKEFVYGTKHALEVVSHKLANGELNSLHGLVTSDIIPNLQTSLSHMSLSQREQIAVNRKDIYFSFPYEMGIIMNEDVNDPKRFVEITMVFHAYRGFSSTLSNYDSDIMLSMSSLKDHQRFSISNYKFIREYTNGIQSDWTINLLNHFKPPIGS